MKSIYKLAVVAALALSSAGLASAQGLVHVTGSTAFRVADVSAEEQICGGATGGATAAYWGSNLTGSNYSVVYGGGWTFENFFNGSIAGDEALVDGVTQINYPSGTNYSSSATACTDPVVATVTPAAGGTQIASSGNPAVVDTAFSDLAFSDCFFSTADQVILASTDSTATVPGNTGSLAANVVGIIPFVFVNTCTSDVPGAIQFGSGATAVYGLSGLSMNPQNFTYLWSKGTAKLGKFTGLSADDTYTAYAMGRDVDSGTRATTLSETGDGLNGSGNIIQAIKQYYPYDNTTDESADQTAGNTSNGGVYGFTTGTAGVCGIASGATSIGVLGFVPKEGVDGYTMALGDGGFYSGGNQAKGMSTPFNGPTASVIMGSLGVSDAATALSRGAQLMAYNGVVFSPNTISAANSAEIYEGQYTFWGYEHLYYLTGASANVTTAFNDFVTQLKTNEIDQVSSNGVSYALMKVTRSGDGQNVQ